MYAVHDVCHDSRVRAHAATHRPRIVASTPTHNHTHDYPRLQRLDEVFAGWWPIAGVNKAALAAFRDSDHMRGTYRKPGQPLGDAVRDLVERETGVRPAGVIRILTHLAYFGYCFNPVSFYFVYDAAEPSRVETVVAEVSNTPW